MFCVLVAYSPHLTSLGRALSPPLLPFTLGNHYIVYIYVRLIQTTSELQALKWHPLCKGVNGPTRDKATKFLAQNPDF